MDERARERGLRGRDLVEGKEPARHTHTHTHSEPRMKVLL